MDDVEDEQEEQTDNKESVFAYEVGTADYGKVSLLSSRNETIADNSQIVAAV
jgi:hypothetical protein